MLTAENTSRHFPIVAREVAQSVTMAAQVMESMKQVGVLVPMGRISQGPVLPEEKLLLRNGESAFSRDEPP